MRIKTFTQGGYTDGGFTSGGGTMTGPLILSGQPTKELEAATKQYADTKTASFDASKFTAGTLQTGRLPAFTGDVVSSTGTNSLSLAPTGVGAGVYSKVTVNAKGLITAGAGLTESDIPDLDWAKVTSGKPTTLVGYGITDAVTKAGGTITGMLTLHADPTSSTHLATKQYVDNSAGGASALKTGDIITKLTATTPTGFLRCNGAQVSKTAYAALYAVVGDTFSISNVPGGGRPWEQQYSFNEQTSNLLTTWTTGTTNFVEKYMSACVVTKNRVYLIGGYVNGGYGYQSGNYSSEINYAPINADGTLGAWVSAGNLNFGSYGGTAIVIRNRVVFFTGNTQGGGSGGVFTASIDANGVLGTFNLNQTLPVPCIDVQPIITKNRVYLLGGVYTTTNTASNVIYSATLDTSGNLGTFMQDGTLPEAVAGNQVAVIRDYVYIFGGNVNGLIYRALIGSDGTISAFAVYNYLPITVNNFELVTTRNKVYIIGGSSPGSTSLSAIYSAPINVDGSIGSWTKEGDLPATRQNGNCIVTSSKLYVIQGGNATPYSRTVYGVNFAGGLNDYSPYYNGSIVPTTTTNFKLPDLSASDLNGAYSYIKT